MKHILLIFALTLFTSHEIKAQCNLRVDDLEKLCAMDTSQLRSYATEHGWNFVPLQKEIRLYECSNDKKIWFERVIGLDKYFHYSYADTSWEDTLVSELIDNGYIFKKEIKKDNSMGIRFESKKFIFNLYDNNNSFSDIEIKKK